MEQTTVEQTRGKEETGTLQTLGSLSIDISSLVHPSLCIHHCVPLSTSVRAPYFFRLTHLPIVRGHPERFAPFFTEGQACRDLYPSTLSHAHVKEGQIKPSHHLRITRRSFTSPSETPNYDPGQDCECVRLSACLSGPWNL